jgi:hypothetical protein
MPELETHHQDSLRREHLARVHALSQQVASAISAIEQNNMEQLRASVAVQEMVCQEITRTKFLLPSGNAKTLAEPGQAALIEQIREAHIALAKLNQVYAALLKRAQRSCSLMVAVYRNYGQGYAKHGPAVSEHHTWSCEG